MNTKADTPQKMGTAYPVIQKYYYVTSGIGDLRNSEGSSWLL